MLLQRINRLAPEALVDGFHHILPVPCERAGDSGVAGCCAPSGAASAGSVPEGSVPEGPAPEGSAPECSAPEGCGAAVSGPAAWLPEVAMPPPFAPASAW